MLGRDCLTGSEEEGSSNWAHPLLTLSETLCTSSFLSVASHFTSYGNILSVSSCLCSLTVCWGLFVTLSVNLGVVFLFVLSLSSVLLYCGFRYAVVAKPITINIGIDKNHLNGHYVYVPRAVVSSCAWLA